MKRREPPDQVAFDKLLFWLDPDREKAGEKYEKIQRRLIRIFTARGCCDADDLADVTMNVVSSKIDWLIANYVGDPSLYFYAVAKKIYLESIKPRPEPPPPAPLPDNSEVERACACLDRCLLELDPGEALLITRYHEDDGRGRIQYRKQLAAELKISRNALRIRACHLHARLKLCVEKCLADLPGN
jgi:hypothetical protein